MDTLPRHAPQGNTFIYVLVDPETEQVRYVGKTDLPHRRLSDHMKDKKKTHKTTWIASLLRKGLEPIMRIIEECPQSEWQERECYWIAYYRSLGYRLTNGSDGGDGIINPTTEDRAKRSKNIRRIMSDPVEKARRAKKGAETRRNLVAHYTVEDHMRLARNVRRGLSGKPKKQGVSRSSSKKVKAKSDKPKGYRSRGTRLSEGNRVELQVAFLLSFAVNFNVRTSCEEVGVSRAAFYQWIQGDTVFNAQYQEIKRCSLPLPVRSKGQRLTNEQRHSLKSAFLSSFSVTLNVRFSAKIVGISHAIFYQWLQNDEQFRLQYQQIEVESDPTN